MNSDENNLKTYIYSIAPDYSYIDYFDREYALRPSELENNPMCVIHASNTIKLKGRRRCLLISPTTLNAGSPKLTTNDASVILQLNDYAGRYIYAVMCDDDDAFIDNEITLEFGALSNDGSDVNYIMELRF